MRNGRDHSIDSVDIKKIKNMNNFIPTNFIIYKQNDSLKNSLSKVIQRENLKRPKSAF